MFSWVPAWPLVLAHRALGDLFEERCLGCGTDGETVCDGCASCLDPMPSRRCERCQGSLVEGGCPLCRGETPPFVRVLALGRYSGVLRRVVHALKYERRADLGLWLGERVAEAIAPADTPWVVPMPVHPWRRWERGFNQTEPVAWAIARAHGLAYRPRALRRIALAKPSYMRGRSDRWKCRGKTFVADGVRGRSIWLVDDVMTSGATAWSAAQALMRAGAAEVTVVVAARAALRRTRLKPGV